MKILVLGAGGVGSSIAAIAAERNFYDKIILGDIDEGRASKSIEGLDSAKFSSMKVDASSKEDIVIPLIFD